MVCGVMVGFKDTTLKNKKNMNTSTLGKLVIVSNKP